MTELIHPGTIAKKELEARGLLDHRCYYESPSTVEFVRGLQDLNKISAYNLTILLPDITEDFWWNLQSDYNHRKQELLKEVSYQLSVEKVLSRTVLKRYVDQHPIFENELKELYAVLKDSSDEHY